MAFIFKREKIIYIYINMEHNYHLDKIKKVTETRFKPYFNLNILDINFKKDEERHFEINIEINLILNKFKEELEKLKRTDSRYDGADINNIIDQINYLIPILIGYINLNDKEAHINIVKVGLFTTTSGNFTPIERDLIQNTLGGHGIGALLVLMFVYFCYSFNKFNNNPSDKIQNISLDDCSPYPGWYKKILFEYPDDDEVAKLDLTPENFKKLQQKILEYTKKSDGKEIHVFDKITLDIINLDLLTDVASNPETYRAASDLVSIRGYNDRDSKCRHDYSMRERERERDCGIRKKNKKSKNRKRKKSKKKKSKNKKTRKRYKKRLTSKKKF